MERRKFISAAAVLFSYNLLLSCMPTAKKLSAKTKIVSANAKVAHKLRTQQFPKPTEQETLGTLIVGGGVSGLSAARHLLKNKYTNFKLIELDTAVGGNAKSGQNEVSKYPLAAHYLPLPNTNFPELISFLEEHQIITGYDALGLPIYNEYYLCFEPHERFFYRGLWCDGIPPKSGLMAQDEHELDRFMQAVEAYKHKVGKDGKLLFTIPVEHCSTDAEMLALDRISIKEYLQNNQYQSVFLHWYLDYCCKDDYGSSIGQTSAWAAFHYFASRTGKASNANANDVLTWPEGNHFLVQKLATDTAPYTLKNNLAYQITQAGTKWKVCVYDAEKNMSKEFTCDQVILASPQFANKHLFKNTQAFEKVNWLEFVYYPWIVANITIHNKQELNGIEELSWDNVMYDSKSLGYVNATHQTLHRSQNKTVISYYYNFSEGTPKEEREKVRNYTEQEWEKFILNDLKKAHPEIENLVEEIEVNVLGHGMISPSVGFRSSALRKMLHEGLPGLYFANTDVSGISIFEQGFYRGIKSAKQVLTHATKI